MIDPLPNGAPKPRFVVNDESRLESIAKGGKPSQEAFAGAIHAITEAKNQWLREIMEKVLPPDIFASAYTEKARDRMKVQRYLAANQIRLKQYPDTMQLVRGPVGKEEILGECRVEFRDRKITVSARNMTNGKA